MLERFEALSVRDKLFAGFAVPMALMLIVSTIVFFSLKSLMNSSYWVKHTYEAIDMGKSITTSLVNMETGLRGYLVSGKEEFLEPFYSGEEQFKVLIAETKQKVSDNAYK